MVESEEVDIVGRLWETAGRLGVPGVRWRAPGISGAMVEAAFGVGVPSGVKAWYGACAGVVDDVNLLTGQADIIPGYEPCNTAVAASLIGDVAEDVHLLGDDWVPLLVGGDTSFYALSWGPETGERVITFNPVFGERVSYSSVAQMATAFRVAYECGAYYLNPDLLLDVDEYLIREVDHDYLLSQDWV